MLPAISFFLSAGFPTKVTHLVSDKWQAVCFTDGVSAEIHADLHIYLSHRCFVLCFLASQATVQLCWGITSRCSTQERPCYPTENKQTALPCSWPLSDGTNSKRVSPVRDGHVCSSKTQRALHHPHTDFLSKNIRNLQISPSNFLF